MENDPLSDVCIVKTVCGLPFNSLSVSQKAVLNFNEVALNLLPIFSFLDLAFGVVSESHSKAQKSPRFSPSYFSEFDSFMFGEPSVEGRRSLSDSYFLQLWVFSCPSTIC